MGFQKQCESNRKFIDKRNEREECRKFTIRNHSKRAKLCNSNTQREVDGRKPERACLSPQTDSLAGCIRNAKKGQNRDRGLLSVSADM